MPEPAGASGGLRELGHDRETVRKYAAGVAGPPGAGPEGGEPRAASKPAISTPGSTGGRVSACEPFRERIEVLLEKGLSAERVWRDLCEDHAFGHSYQSVERFVRKKKIPILFVLQSSQRALVRRMLRSKADQGRV